MFKYYTIHNVLGWMKTSFLALIFYTAMPNTGFSSPIKFINYHFENGSPLFWEIQEDSSVLISLIYDYERDSPNRAAGHWHFQVFADKGSSMKLVLQNFNNVWNGRLGSPIHDNTTCYLSVDGKNWEAIETNKTTDNRLEIEFIMPYDSVYVARLEPYRVSDLMKLISEIKDHPLIKVTEIGRTVENHPLEIIRVGHVNAPKRVLIRGRAHPWEPGGNWVIEGLIKNLLKKDPKISKYLESYCIYILPIANMDGVINGGTRFNLRGMDLNRKWDNNADPYLAPENAALEKWLTDQIGLGLKPDLAIDFHNDAGGRLHISRPNINLEQYLANMKKMEDLLRKHSWFTEGSTGSQFRNPGSFGEGLLERYGIDAFVYELNANWIADLNKVPFGDDWMLLGEQLCEVFLAYFSETTSKKKAVTR
jgi:hypothetical protein